MGSNRYRYYTQERFDGGIEERDGFARPNQLADARNMWVPVGNDVLVTRPGYRYLTGLFMRDANFAVVAGSLVSEKPVGTFNDFGRDSVSGIPASGRVYVTAFGTTSAQYPSTYAGLGITVATPNSTSANFRWEYWNGNSWADINVRQIVVGDDVGAQEIRAPSTQASSFMQAASTQHVLCFAPPNDWVGTGMPSGISALGYSSSYRWLRGINLTTAGVSGASARDTAFVAHPNEAISSAYQTLTTYAAFPVKHGKGVCFIAFADFAFDTDSTSPDRLGLAITVTAAPHGHGSVTTSEFTRHVSVSEALNSTNPGANDQYSVFRGSAAPMVAFIPQVDEVFVAYRNRVYNVSPTRLKPASQLLTADGSYEATNYGILRNYFDAQVENDPAFVGDALAAYNKDTVPQLDVFPQASSILYNANTLWASRIQGEPGVVRWSAPAIAGVNLGYRVWPKISFAAVAANEEVTALGALHENTVVTTAGAVFTMNNVGTDTNNLPTYTPTRVGDVGCLSQASMQNWPGHLAWFANEGFYAFDGRPISDNQRFSDPIKSIVSRINKSAAEQMVSAHWDVQNCYVVAVALDGATRNNTLLLYNYSTRAWWVWDNVAARGLYVLDDVLHFMDYAGNIYSFEGKHDYGTAIDAYYTTRRMGLEERLAKTARDVRLTAYGQNVQCALIASDDEQTAASINLGSTDDAKWDTAVWGTGTWPNERIKERHIGVRQAGRWFQLKVSSSSKTTPLQVYSSAVGYIVEGRR